MGKNHHTSTTQAAKAIHSKGDDTYPAIWAYVAALPATYCVKAPAANINVNTVITSAVNISGKAVGHHRPKHRGKLRPLSVGDIARTPHLTETRKYKVDRISAEYTETNGNMGVSMPSARNCMPQRTARRIWESTLMESARAIHQKLHSPYYTDHITEIDTSEQKPAKPEAYHHGDGILKQPT